MNAVPKGRPGASLRQLVALKERQLLMHRQATISHAADLQHRLHTALTGPMVLLVAAGVGVLIEQATRRRGDSLLTMINALSGGRALLMALLAGATHAHPARGADAS